MFAVFISGKAREFLSFALCYGYYGNARRFLHEDLVTGSLQDFNMTPRLRGAGSDLAVRSVIAGIRASMKSAFINNLWRGPADNPVLPERPWNDLDTIMAADGVLDRPAKALIHIAVSIANGCRRRIHSYFATARCQAVGSDGQMQDCRAPPQLPVFE